jgi:hypothetical protein
VEVEVGEEVGAAVEVVVTAVEGMEGVAKKGELVRKSFKMFKSKRFERTRIFCNTVDVQEHER